MSAEETRRDDNSGARISAGTGRATRWREVAVGEKFGGGGSNDAGWWGRCFWWAASVVLFDAWWDAAAAAAAADGQQ